MDTEIEDTWRSIDMGERAHAHKLIMGTPQSRAQYHNVAEDTLYDDDPELDEDVVSTQSHLGGAETSLGHTWIIEE